MSDKILIAKTDISKGELFTDLCKSEGKTVNKKLNEMIEKELSGSSRSFISGKNKVRYDKASNSFIWSVEFDEGKGEVNLISNLSNNFLENLNKEINLAIRDRNDWLKQKKGDSVEIPAGLVKNEN